MHFNTGQVLSCGVCLRLSQMGQYQVILTVDSVAVWRGSSVEKAFVCWYAGSVYRTPSAINWGATHNTATEPAFRYTSPRSIL